MPIEIRPRWQRRLLLPWFAWQMKRRGIPWREGWRLGLMWDRIAALVDAKRGASNG